MKLLANAHTHTNLCDGQNSPLEMVQAAIQLRFHDLGFSAHSPAPFDPSCLGIQNEQEYQQEIQQLKEQYSSQITLLCGIEQDYFAPAQNKYDYTIGSLHYVPVGHSKLMGVDVSPQELQQACVEGFDGNYLKLVQTYYQLQVENIKKYRPEIVGHFDLVVKYNQNNLFFSEESNAYRQIALEALDEIAWILLDYGGMVEINTGAVSRGYRTLPYPAPFLLHHLAQRGVSITINSDSHSANSLDVAFPLAIHTAKQSGFSRLSVLRGGKWQEERLDDYL